MISGRSFLLRFIACTSKFITCLPLLPFIVLISGFHLIFFLFIFFPQPSCFFNSPLPGTKRSYKLRRYSNPVTREKQFVESIREQKRLKAEDERKRQEEESMFKELQNSLYWTWGFLISVIIELSIYFRFCSLISVDNYFHPLSWQLSPVECT